MTDVAWAAIELCAICKSFGISKDMQVRAGDDVSLAIAPGSFVAPAGVLINTPAAPARTERLVRLRDGAVADDTGLTGGCREHDMIRRAAQLG
jgi:hypothetical protein